MNRYKVKRRFSAGDDEREVEGWTFMDAAEAFVDTFIDPAEYYDAPFIVIVDDGRARFLVSVYVDVKVRAEDPVPL